MAKSLRKTTKAQTAEAEKYCKSLLNDSKFFLIIGKSYCPYCVQLGKYLRSVVKDNEAHVRNVDIDILFAEDNKTPPANTTMQAVQDYFWDLTGTNLSLSLCEMLLQYTHTHASTGDRTVPRTFLAGKSIGGQEDVMRLAASGELKEMMKSLGISM